MSDDGWSKVLVLGGIRSGKSEYAESLVAAAPTVRYVATSPGHEDDPEWQARIEAHRGRRPGSWTTEEVGADPSRLAEAISGAKPEETLLVDDLGGWVSVLLDPAHQPADDTATVDELAGAIRACAARLVLVTPEVGLSLVPPTPVGRAFADALGTVNQAVARECDTVVLVVAGQPTWLKAAGAPSDGATTGGAMRGAAGAPAGDGAGAATRDRAAAQAGEIPSPEVLTPTVPPRPVPAAEHGDAFGAPTMQLPIVETGLLIQPGMDLPMPDEDAARAARDRLATLDVPGAGLGNLEPLIAFAAGTQGATVPAPWGAVRVLLLHGDHEGGVAAGTAGGESARRAEQARAGDGALARLAAEAGATLQVVRAPTAGPIEDGPALSTEAVEAALQYGWRLADEAAERGVDAIVLAACGAGSGAAAAAVLAATAGAEPVRVLARVVAPGGRIDDNAWMRRCAAVRDALHRSRLDARGPKEVLAELGGGDIAIATGVLLGAAARRTPVLLDGPVGVAAGLVSREFAGQARHWCLLPDHGGHPAVRLGADVLGLEPVLDLRLDLGEGASALAALPLLRAALSVAASLPEHPALDGDGGSDARFAEPHGPGPAAAPGA